MRNDKAGVSAMQRTEVSGIRLTLNQCLGQTLMCYATLGKLLHFSELISPMGMVITIFDYAYMGERGCNEGAWHLACTQ